MPLRISVLKVGECLREVAVVNMKLYTQLMVVMSPTSETPYLPLCQATSTVGQRVIRGPTATSCLLPTILATACIAPP